MLEAHLISSSSGDFYGKKCEDCSQPLRVGHVAIVLDLGRGVYTNRDRVWHRRCVEAVLRDAPAERDVVEARLDDIRRQGLARILAALA